MITHYDLFAGIGGFSIALEEVFSDATIRHIFCEWESFPTSVLKQHWPDGEYWGDIAELVAHTNGQRERDGSGKVQETDGEVPERHDHAKLSNANRLADTNPNNQRLERGKETRNTSQSRSNIKQRPREQDIQHSFTIVTGGFPCQPFSHAGRRKGTADDRYQWPNMYEVIRNTKPDWVIAENVRGLVTWNEGMVLEQVCTDLESEGYEVQPFIIPAVAVGAPHRRDRVWIIAHRNDSRKRTPEDGVDKHRQTEAVKGVDQPLSRSSRQGGIASDSGRQRWGEGSNQDIQPSRQESGLSNGQHPDWSRNWQEVAFATCDDSVDDGLSRLVDGVPYSRPKWRQNSLKAYGNGIVPQVAIEIMRGIADARRT